MLSGHTKFMILITAIAARNTLLFQNGPVFMKLERQLVNWLVYVNLTQAIVIWEKGTSIEKKPQKDWAIRRQADRAFN